MKRTMLAAMAAAGLLALAAVPAHAQLVRHAPATAQGAAATDGTAPHGVVVRRLGATADRTQAFGPGLRLTPREGAYVGYHFGNNWSVGSTLHADDDLDRPSRLDLGARYDFAINSRNRLSFDGGVSLRTPLDRALNGGTSMANSYFGQEPGAGFRLSWRYSFSQDHYISTSLGFDRRFNSGLHDGPDADRGGATFGTFYGYRFR